MIDALIAAMLAAAASDGPSRPVWATVTRATANGSARVSLEFGTLGTSANAHRLQYYARRTNDGWVTIPAEIAWADSQTCPALTEVLAELRDVPVPKIDVPGFPRRPGGSTEAITLDGVSYSLALSELFSFTASADSALSRWTEAALQRLEPCWGAEMPDDIG